MVDAKQAADVLNGRTSSFSIFLIVFIIVLFFITVLLAFNASFYWELRSGGCPGKVTEEEAEAMFWLSVILAILAGIGVLVGIFMFFFARAKPKWTVYYIPPAKPEFSDPQSFAARQAQILELQKQAAAMQAQLRGQAAAEAAKLQQFAT